MRLAWIKMGGLWPLNTGGRQRTFHILSQLSRRHRVTVLTTHGPADDPAGLESHLPDCEAVISIPFAGPKVGSPAFVGALARSWVSADPVDLTKWRVPQVLAALRTAMARQPFDVLVADFLVSEPNVPFGTGTPVVFFSHNVEYLIWKRLAGVESRRMRRLLLEVEWRKMRRAETRAIRRATRTIAVSEADRAVFAADVPGAPIDVVPTGVDLEYFRRAPGPPVRHRLVFSGSMDWYPNEDAIAYFADAIWPRLRTACPDVTLTVVGRRPSSRIVALGARAGFVVTGTVDDVRPYVDEAEVYIVPLRVGGGTRLKCFEALAMAKPMVSTTIGVEGLGLEPGRHVVIADAPDRFASAILALFDDAERRRAIGDAGAALVHARFGWPQVAREFESFLERALAPAPTHQVIPISRVAVS